MIGTRVGIYEIVEEIGKGGMATVYRAYQPNMERYVAVKVIHRSIAVDNNGLERFTREAKLVARLEHPHLLPVYDYDGKHDPPYIVMRYLESGTLKDVLDRVGALPLRDIASMMRQICSALDYAHRQGVIHRDIKPSNVMVDQDGNAFLMDFGIARINEAGQGLTQTGFAVGTPGYMSPEQGIGDAGVDGRTDIYALGVMLFQMVTGAMPYNAETPMGVILKHIQEPVPSARAVNPDLPQDMDDIIQKAMAKKPADRYATATELADDLIALAGTVTTSRTASNKLREAAQQALRELQQEREARKDEFQKTMNTFAAVRGGKTPPTTELDGPTLMTPTEQRTAPRPNTGTMATPEAQTRSPLPFILGAVGVIAALVVAFLVFGRPPEVTPTPTTAATAVVVAGSTDTDVPPTRTDAPPTSTSTDSPTDTPTRAVPTPATPIAGLLQSIAVRVGPGPQYPTIQSLDGGIRLEIAGVSEDGRWYQVLLPDGSLGWIVSSEAFISLSGNPAVIQQVEGPTATFTLTPSNTPTDTPTHTPTATFTPSDTPTNTATATSTPSDTPTFTPTLTPSDTPTDTPTIPPSSTPTETPIPTDTPTLTPTHTATDTPTLTPTFTPSETPTLTPSFTPSPIPTDTPTETPTPTPVPVGLLPFVADFEGATPLQFWDYDPSLWQVINDGGQNILIGQARLDQPMVVLGSREPEWLQSQDLMINFRMYLDPQAAGLRVIFRHTEGVGYNVLEMLPGLMFLRRNAPSDPSIFNRDTERIIRNVNANIQGNTWHDVSIWVQGGRIFVYLDRALVMQGEDLATPQLGAGQILLQTNSSQRPVRVDDLIIQRPEAASDHFQAGTLPRAWSTSNIQNTTIGSESNGNQFVRIQNEVKLSPDVGDIKDFALRCRLQSAQGGYIFRLRDSESGRMTFTAVGGNLTITEEDAFGAALNTYNVPNFYTRERWQDLDLMFVDNRLSLYLDGRQRFEENLSSSPSAGGINFETKRNDVFFIDDCVVTQTALVSNFGANASIERRNAVLAREFRLLRSDLDDNFDEIFRTDDWWVGGQRAAGTFTTDETSATNKNFLRMTYGDRPTWRLFRDVIGIEIFEPGTDTRNFRDSTDVYASVQVRLRETGQAAAWMGIRTTPTITGAELTGYFLQLQRNADNTVTLTARFRDTVTNEVVFEGMLPDMTLNPNDWNELAIMSYDDEVAFFINGTFITVIEKTTKLNGTVALGVEPNTTADFDTLLIRDTSPHDAD